MKLRELREFMERGMRAQAAVDRIIADVVPSAPASGPVTPTPAKKTPRRARRRSTKA